MTDEEITFFKVEVNKESCQTKQARTKLQQKIAETSSKDTAHQVMKYEKKPDSDSKAISRFVSY